MKKIGYSLIEIETDAVVWAGSLPARIELRGENGQVTFRADIDRPQALPDEENPTHKMVERMLDEPPPSDLHSIVGETETFDGEKVVVVRKYEILPASPEPTPKEKIEAMLERNGITLEEFRKVIGS